MKYWRVTFIVAAMAASTAAWAASRDLEELFACDADARVSIDNVSGSVTVRPWDRPEIKIDVKVGSDVERVEFSRSRSRPGVEVILPKRSRGRTDKDCHIDVMCPRGVSLDIEAVSADIHVAGIHGDTDINSVSGDVEIKDAANDVEIKNVSGEIDVAGEMRALQISTISGGVEIAGSSKTIGVESVSGSITVGADADEARLHTTSGQITAKGILAAIDSESVSGRINIEEIHLEADVASMSGSIHVLGAMPRDLSLASISGDVRYEGGLHPGGRLDMSSKSGALRVALPSNIDASFDISTLSGGIHNELGGGQQRDSRGGPGKALSFKTGEGRSQIELESASGDVQIKSLPPMAQMPPANLEPELLSEPVLLVNP